MSGWALPLTWAGARSRWVLPVVLTAGLLAACGQVGPPVEQATPHPVPPHRIARLLQR